MKILLLILMIIYLLIVWEIFKNAWNDTEEATFKVHFLMAIAIMFSPVLLIVSFISGTWKRWNRRIKELNISRLWEDQSVK